MNHRILKLKEIIMSKSFLQIKESGLKRITDFPMAKYPWRARPETSDFRFDLLYDSPYSNIYYLHFN